MTEAVRSWLSCVVAAALMVEAVRALTPVGGVRRVEALIGGLLLMAAMIAPLRGLRPWTGSRNPSGIADEIRHRQEVLSRESGEQWASLAAARYGAVIVNHAAASHAADAAGVDFPAADFPAAGFLRDAAVTVDTSSGFPLPRSVELWGVRDSALERWIAENLGIPPERQVWHPVEDMMEDPAEQTEAET